MLFSGNLSDSSHLSLSFSPSRDYLRDNPHLICEDTASYLTMWCVNLEMQEVHAQCHVSSKPLSFCFFCCFLSRLPFFKPFLFF